MENQLKTVNGAMTKQDIQTLQKAGIIPANTPTEQIYVFAAICREQGLSPFSKEIYLVGYKGKYTPITGINGLRKKAIETGLHAGCSQPMFDMMPDGSFKTAAQYNKGQKPNTCTIVIYKVVGGFRCPFESTVVFSEFAGFGKWSSMPFQMIAKVAEAHAIRKAFAITGVFIEEETDAINDTVSSTPQREKPVFDPNHKGWEATIEGLKSGKFSVGQIVQKYTISDEDLATLQTAESEKL
jgi:phage recombination protein Bet